MTPILITLSNWLHALATVIFIGHFVLLALIYLPALATNGNGLALSEISKRSRSWMYAIIAYFHLHGNLPDDRRHELPGFCRLWELLGDRDAGEARSYYWNDRNGILVQLHPARWAANEFKYGSRAGNFPFPLVCQRNGDLGCFGFASHGSRPSAINNRNRMRRNDQQPVVLSQECFHQSNSSTLSI